MNKYAALLFLLLVGLTGCHDHDDDLVDVAGWTVAWEDGGKEADIDLYGRYYSLYTVTTGKPDSTLTIATNADWLTVISTTLPADGIIQVLAEPNKDGKARTADIIVRSNSHPEQQTVLTIRQRGLGDDRTNDGDDPDPLSDFRVGWGFNAFEEYKSLNSQRGHIIDAVRLGRFDSDTTFHSMQETVRAVESFQVISAWSLQEMSMKLTKEMTSQTDILVVKKTTHRFSEVTKHSVSEQACSYARLQKTVVTRSMDEGALRYLVKEKGVTDLPFTDSFRKAYNKVLNSSGVQRENAIRELIDNYGTHLIISASAGCKMDLCLTFEKSSNYEFEKETEETSKKVFGRTKKTSNTKTSEHLTSDLSNQNSIQVSGGSDATRTRLLGTIKTLTNSKVLDGDLVVSWLASVSPNDLNDASRRKNLDVVDFRFMPIWELFADADAKANVQSYIMAMSSRSDCDFTDLELGIDNYVIDLKDANLAKFGTASNASLVRVARDKVRGTPLLQVCEEYVPKVRSDRRIVVYYPILEGRARIGQGVFRGDGDYPPAMLTFSEGEVYVDPIDDYGMGDILDTLYYVHGNLYSNSFGIAMQNIELKTTNEVFRIDKISTPILKIGSGYWTRRNVNESLWFGVPWDVNNPNGGFNIYEQIKDSMLFANVFYGNAPEFRERYPGLFDDEEDEQTREAIHWYGPKSQDLEQLHDYIGKNVKSLFKGQVSGFDAQFVGYWGSYDAFDPTKTYGTAAYHYAGDYCFIPAKNSPYDGHVMAVGANYTTRILTIDSNRANWYPIRAFRTSYFTYK